MVQLQTNLYMKGKVITIGKTYIILESNYSGYIIYVNNPDDYKKDEEHTIYIYKHSTQFLKALFGFQTQAELDTFADLLKIKGVGVKTAMKKMRGLKDEKNI